MAKKLANFTEHIQAPPEKVNIEEGVIYGAKLLGRVSKNGREYSSQALSDAARLYEGIVVNVDHPDPKASSKPRGFLEGVAVVQKPRLTADGVFGDLHVIKAHPAASPLLEWASRFPGNFGLSHNADGVQNGKMVESLDRVISVDVVRNPATVKGLFESEQPMSKKTIRQVIEAEFPKTHKVAGLLEMDGMADMPVEVPAEASGDDQIWAAFKAAIMSAVDDDKLDTKSTLKKIGEILKAYEKLDGSASSEPASEPPADEPKTESDKLMKQIGALLESKLAPVTKDLELIKRDAKIKQLCEQHNVVIDAGLLESLSNLPNEAAMKSLLEREAKLRPRYGRPKPIVESVGNSGGASDVKYPADNKSFVAAIGGR